MWRSKNGGIVSMSFGRLWKRSQEKRRLGVKLMIDCHLWWKTRRWMRETCTSESRQYHHLKSVRKEKKKSSINNFYQNMTDKALNVPCYPSLSPQSFRSPYANVTCLNCIPIASIASTAPLEGNTTTHELTTSRGVCSLKNERQLHSPECRFHLLRLQR
jgi:hypothetical protein